MSEGCLAKGGGVPEGLPDMAQAFQYQPTRNIRNRRFTTIIDEDTAGWYAGLVTSETTDAIGHITIRVRFPPPDTCPYEFVLKKGVLSSVSKKLRWRYDESNDEHDLLNRGI